VFISDSLGKISHIANQGNGYGRAVVDLTVLSRADYMILTPSSTFGFLASIMNGRLERHYVTNSRFECTQIKLSNTGWRVNHDKTAPESLVIK